MLDQVSNPKDRFCHDAACVETTMQMYGFVHFYSVICAQSQGNYNRHSHCKYYLPSAEYIMVTVELGPSPRILDTPTLTSYGR